MGWEVTLPSGMKARPKSLRRKHLKLARGKGQGESECTTPPASLRSVIEQEKGGSDQGIAEWCYLPALGTSQNTITIHPQPPTGVTHCSRSYSTGMLRWGGALFTDQRGGHTKQPRHIPCFEGAAGCVRRSDMERKGARGRGNDDDGSSGVASVAVGGWRQISDDGSGESWVAGGRVQDILETCDPSFLPPLSFLSFPFLSFPPPTRTCDIDAFSMEIF